MKKVIVMLFILFCYGQSFGQQQGQTLANLQKAYQAEANASRRYAMFAEQAAEENLDQVARLFRAVSKSESIHMRNHQQAIEAMGATPDAIVYEEVEVEKTRDNLKEPIEGEKQETEAMYPEYVKIAKMESVPQATKSFTYAMEAEAQHEKLFEDALKNLGKNKKKDYYVSSVTGATFEVSPGKPAPKPKLAEEEYLLIEK
ncbi:rubrerythrin family protein [Pontibacter sp. MBLB2868]|uniref:rubrerythrin family protein n=1 Tax=Pontibacter sp. MBLB2868 TaxID=3451555 RepID=UPI003F74DBEA